MYGRYYVLQQGHVNKQQNTQKQTEIITGIIDKNENSLCFNSVSLTKSHNVKLRNLPTLSKSPLHHFIEVAYLTSRENDSK